MLMHNIHTHTCLFLFHSPGSIESNLHSLSLCCTLLQTSRGDESVKRIKIKTPPNINSECVCVCVCSTMQPPFAFCIEMSFTLHCIYILESLHMSCKHFHALSMWNILREKGTLNKSHTVRWRKLFSLLSHSIATLLHFISTNEC